jgi:hypothetical protein
MAVEVRDMLDHLRARADATGLEQET